jgi:dihydroceramidase
MLSLADELSMHLAIGTMMHRVFTFEQPLATQRRVTALILGVLVPFFIYHCVADEFLLHVLLFAGMVIAITFKTSSIITARIPSESDRRRLIKLVHFGSFCAALAYTLWNIDVNFCGTLTRWKHAVGMPWGILLEFHGYWHILTGITAYNSMAVVEYLTAQSEESAQGLGFAWPSKDVIREIAAGRGAVNATKKKE